ncbi:MAG TPA: tetratricopeptide repeat protein [Tepidisphaeraceae bacterium]|nr:tetratricopeptide repeat protein [Tepidisphaeraceae bacterium]
MNAPRQRLHLPVAILVLLGIVLGTYWPVLRNQFVDFDDQTEIYQNPDFNPVTARRVAWNWSHTRMTLYMPLTYTVWGGVAAISPREAHGTLTAWPFHALNLALHAACVLLVFLLLRQLGMTTISAAFGAAVFAVHPMQTEAIAWASGMYTLLGAALALGAMIVYLRSGDGSRSRASRVALYALATAMYVAALLSKAAMAATPLVAIAIDLLVLRRRPRRTIIAMLPWIILSLVAAFVARSFQSAAQVAHVSLPGRALVALDAIGFYVGKLLWPAQLAPDYGRNPNWVMHHLASAAIAAVGALVLLLLAISLAKRGRWWSAGIFIFVAGLSPYLGLVPFDFQPVTTVADRYAYFGIIGVALLAALAARWRSGRILLVAALLIWSMLSWRQADRWHDSQRLFEHTLSVNPDSIVAQTVLAFEARRDGRFNEAEQRYLRVLQIWPDDAAALFNLGNLYLATNRLPQAVEMFDRATRALPSNAQMHNNYGVALARLGDRAAAARQFQAAIDLNPDWPDPRRSLAKLRSTSTQP